MIFKIAYLYHAPSQLYCIHFVDIEIKIASQKNAGDEETRAFYIQDVSQIDKILCQWKRELPSVSAFYGTASFILSFDLAEILPKP